MDILLVEDNPGDATLVRQALYECPVPVRLHVAGDGQQALRMLTEASLHPDLIILDLNLPKMSGTALLERWRSDAAPVVVFSSSSNPIEKERCLQLGARDFVTKPIDLEDFTEAVSGIVDLWASPWESLAGA